LKDGRPPVDKGLIIDFQWLGWPTSDPLDRALSADIGLAVGDDWLTLLEDREASTVRTHLRSSVYNLAIWFASNWWRLRWEPGSGRWPQDAEWRVAHNLASAGGGYVWPDVLFVSDGDSLKVSSYPQVKPAACEPIRYLNRIDAFITAVDFERKVDAFLASVLSRLGALDVTDETLPKLWAEVLAERDDAAVYEHRKLEAIAGFDPDNAPDTLLTKLMGYKTLLGKGALEEIVADSRHESVKVLESFSELSKFKSKPGAGGFRSSLPRLDTKPKRPIQLDQPWKTAARLAQTARKEWGFDGITPISNQALGELVNADPAIFNGASTEKASLPAALRAGEKGKFDIYFNSPHATTRRFSLSRLIGDRLHYSPEERLLPATNAKTSRQKFQRSFAREFLCPIEALIDKMQTLQPGPNDIEEAASHFQVSPLMVRTTLVNHHELGREALSWDD
jgi:hypothetical protein